MDSSLASREVNEVGGASPPDLVTCYNLAKSLKSAMTQFNLLLTGNIGSGKSSICRELLRLGVADEFRYYAIDELRRRFSDGSYGGEYYAWSLMFRAGQTEMSGLFEFSGAGRNAPIFREVMKDSMDLGRLWYVVNCQCHIDVIGERLSDKPCDVPIPYKQWKTHADKMESAEHAKVHIDARIGIDFWHCPELTVFTDKHSLEECTQQILDWLDSNPHEFKETSPAQFGLEVNQVALAS